MELKKAFLGCGAALLGVSLLFPASLMAGGSLATRAVFYNNSAHIVQDPTLPISIDGVALSAGHPWYEARIALSSGPSEDLNPKIEVSSSIAPSNFFRLPGRFIPSPYDDATFSSAPVNIETFAYTSQWPQLFTPRDGRNTVVLTLVNRNQCILFSTNFDLQYSLAQEVIKDSTGVQTATIQLTPRTDNQTIIVRLRSEATQAADVQFAEGTASPPPSSETPTSVIWTVSNPAADKTLTFTVQDAVSNLAFPTAVRNIPGLLVTSSQTASSAGTDVDDSVNFPTAFLPSGINGVRYSLSRAANWTLDYADRTLVDIREVTELVP